MGALSKGNTSTKDGNTPATEIAFDRLIELVLSDEPEYPNDTVFIPADAPAFGEMMLKELGVDRPIVVVFADGRERLIPAQAAACPSKAVPRRS